VKQRSKSRGKTRVKCSVKHVRKKMKKCPSPTCYIHSTSQIVTVMSLTVFTISAPGTSKRLFHPPISMKMLAQLVDNLNLNSPLDLVIAACAVTAFWGQCHLGKLLLTSLSTLTNSPLLMHADFKRSLHNPLSCILHLPQTLVNQHQPINLISFLKRHL
jgi:hypothetical protein